MHAKKQGNPETGKQGNKVYPYPQPCGQALAWTLLLLIQLFQLLDAAKGNPVKDSLILFFLWRLDATINLHAPLDKESSQMLQGGISSYLIPLGRTLAGFIAALLLAFLGDVTARVFNLAIGFPWSQAVHQNIILIGIGVGAGIGAYLAWMSLSPRWYLLLGWVMLVLAGGIVGAYLGSIYGPGVDPTYWWSRFATDPTIYLSAAALSTIVATILGLINDICTTARRRAEFKHLQSSNWAIRQ